jgi:CubicO group peptidase (beta-lactamase class C family)
MPRTVTTMLSICLIVLLSCNREGINGKDLETISPEDAGWSSVKLDDAARYAGEIGYTALMLVSDGKVFCSWGEVERNYWCHSIRKPFLGSLYGIYVDNNTIDLDVTIGELGIDDIPPELTAEEKKATIRQLLMARSGIYHEAAAEAQVMIASRPERGSHPPGTHFYYNNWDFNALGTIFRQLTGKDIFEEFEKRIADPIGMKDFEASECAYEHEEDRSEHPAYKFRMSARDMARFGVLYQKGGIWEGKQIVPSDWVTESTATHSVADSTMGAGFGYMWGTILEGGMFEKLMGGTGFYFSGIGVHNLIILDDPKIVMVLRYDTDGEWDPPQRGTSGKLYTMIAGARIGGNE